MLQFDEYKVKLNNIKPSLDELSQALDLPAAERELDMLNSESAAPGFWDDLEKSQKVTRRMRQLENKLEAQRKREREWDDLMALCEMGNEFEDESLVPELEEGFARLEEEIGEAKLATLLTGEYDNSNAILTFHAGAGGTEAQDWAQMLYRMYTRWAERPRLHLPDHRLPGRRRGRHQVGHHHDRGRERLRLPQERARRPPAGPGLPL